MGEGCGLLVNTPYDDVFRTLLNDCSSLIIPLVNEIFHESYSGDEAVEFYPNEHFVNGQDGAERERVTDSCFGIRGRSLKKYHIEWLKPCVGPRPEPWYSWVEAARTAGSPHPAENSRWARRN